MARGTRTRALLSLVCLAPAFGPMLASSAQAANPAFQTFFFDVCLQPQGALASRCATTPDAAGDLSGNSESSLNPTQGLSSGDMTRGNAEARARELRDRLHDDQSDQGYRLQLGKVSLLANARYTDSELARSQSTAAERGYQGTGWSGDIGVDYRLNDRWVVGLFAGMERSELRFGGGEPGVNFTPVRSSGSIEADSFAATLYATWMFGESGYVDMMVSQGQDAVDFARNAEFQESTRTTPQTAVRTQASVDGEQRSMAVMVGGDLGSSALRFGYFAGIQHAQVEIDSFRERDQTGSGLAMSFGRSEQDSTTLIVGASVRRSYSLSWGVLLPQIRLEAERALSDSSVSGTAGYLLDGGGNRYEFSASDPDDGWYTAGIGLVAVLPNGWQPYLDVDFMLGRGDLEQYRISAGLRREL